MWVLLETGDLGNPQYRTPGEHPYKQLNGESGIGIAKSVTCIAFSDTRPKPLFSDTVNQVRMSSRSAFFRLKPSPDVGQPSPSMSARVQDYPELLFGLPDWVTALQRLRTFALAGRTHIDRHQVVAGFGDRVTHEDRQLAEAHFYRIRPFELCPCLLTTN